MNLVVKARCKDCKIERVMREEDAKDYVCRRCSKRRANTKARRLEERLAPKRCIQCKGKLTRKGTIFCSVRCGLLDKHSYFYQGKRISAEHPDYFKHVGKKSYYKVK